MIELHKYSHDLFAPIMKEIFIRNCNVNLSPNPKTTKHGIYTVVYKAGKFWSMLRVWYM